MTIRQFAEGDREVLCQIAVRVFGPVSIHAAIEGEHGKLNDVSWQDRKREDINADLDAHPEGCFVAEVDGQIAGFITTAIDRETGVGRIPNLGVDAGHQGQGVGKALLSHCLDYFESEGLRYTQIETVTANERGQRFYPSFGYREVSRKIYYFMQLADRRDR